MNDNRPLLEVQNLKKYFKTKRGMLHAVDDVTFTIGKGKTLGVVGESGCGKSTTGRAILRLIEPTGGCVLFDGEDISRLSNAKMRAKRREMQIIFQDPFSSLDPRMSVSQIIEEPMRLHGMYKSSHERETQTLKLMDTVGLARRLYNTYPHELDGGRRQRIGIARALSLNPKFIVCDEPVSALDVSIQAQILNLMKDTRAFGGPATYLGHAIGLGVDEPPVLAKRDKTVLIPGMVITVEPGLYQTGHGGCRIEDEVLVTETGTEILNTFDRRWWN